MGGEKYLPCFNADGFVGSPARWRGKAVKFRCTCGLQRITPAWAGKSKLALCTPSCPTDHPRAGREKNKELEGVWLPMGSPPRWRGKATFSGRSDPGVGITPAWAGKSRIDKLEWIPVKDHPRVGGEKPVGYDLLQRPAGITPAWAGKRYCRQSPPRAGWDHPRVGGEKYRETFPVPQSVGSPPRGRGKAPVFRYAG